MSAQMTKMMAKLETRKARIAAVTRLVENAQKPSGYYSENEYEAGFEQGEVSLAHEILAILKAPVFKAAYQPGNPNGVQTEEAMLMVESKTYQALIARIRKQVQNYSKTPAPTYYYEEQYEVGHDRGEAAMAVKVRKILSTPVTSN